MAKKVIKTNIHTVTCKYCGNVFLWPHKGRRYCVGTNCKDNWNNRKKTATYHLTKFEVGVAKKNWAIIRYITRKGYMRTSVNELAALGFTFGLLIYHSFTEQQMQRKAGDTYFFSGFSLEHLGNEEFGITLD